MSGPTVRFYLPVTVAGLRRARAEGRFAPAPLAGHAVTPALAAAYAEASGRAPDEEELEYAATTAAAEDALGLLGAEDRPRRLVAALDVPRVEAAGAGAGPSAAVVPVEVPWRRLASVLADDARAAADVAAARSALASGAADADDRAERCLDHELGWYAVQELDAVLDG